MTEIRTIYGITMEQKRNDALINESLFQDVIVKSGPVSTASDMAIFQIVDHFYDRFPKRQFAI